MKVVTSGGRPVRGVAACTMAASTCLLAIALSSLLASIFGVRWCGAGQRQQHRQWHQWQAGQAGPGVLLLPGSDAAAAAAAAFPRQDAEQLEPPRVLGLAEARAAAAPGPRLWGAAWGPAAAAAGPWRQGAGIPKILHRIYIADPQDPRRAGFTMPIAHEGWIQGCQMHYSRRAGWQYMFWDRQAAEALIANHYPWFLPFYQSNATQAIEKSDLVRYAIMHRVGGLYLDSDIECWREGSDLLEGWDIVLQATHFNEGVTNAAIAARPGLEVFIKALQLVQSREVNGQEWVRVIQRTGPDLLADALVALGVPRLGGEFAPKVTHRGVVYRMYPAGTFILPCLWWEKECRRRVYQERISGQADMRLLIGFHRLVGSWIQGKEDGIGILNTTAELCGGATHVGPNGLPGGWVAPENSAAAKKAEEEQGSADARTTAAASEKWGTTAAGEEGKAQEAALAAGARAKAGPGRQRRLRAAGSAV